MTRTDIDAEKEELQRKIDDMTKRLTEADEKIEELAGIAAQADEEAFK